MSNSVKASSLVLPQGQWSNIYDYLCFRFESVSAEIWSDRFERGKVLDENYIPLTLNTPFQPGKRIFYYREISNESVIPFTETILYQDEHILIADKPHFLPVVPAGSYVRETLLSRLIQKTNNPELQPLHRIDRHTAGLVLFSVNKQTRGTYQSLFSQQRIHKSYEAIAPALPELNFPHVRQSRIVQGDQFFLSQETAGDINAITEISVLKKQSDYWKYKIQPVTGKKHQIRLHMFAIGAPLMNDCFYPKVDDEVGADFERPLQLLAKHLSFDDPLNGRSFSFESALQLLF